jgi:hypothetical protein
MLYNELYRNVIPYSHDQKENNVFWQETPFFASARKIRIYFMSLQEVQSTLNIIKIYPDPWTTQTPLLPPG